MLDSTVEQYQIIKELIHRNEYKKAIEMCNQELSRDPKNRDFLLALFGIYQKKHDTSSSLKVLSLLREYGHFDAALHVHLIKVLSKLCKFEEAYKELTLLKEMSSVDLLEVETNLCMDMGEIEKAAELLALSYAKAPKNMYILNKYGNVLHNIGKKAQAIQIFLELYNESPDFSSLYWGLANIKSYSLEAEQLKSVQRIAKLNLLPPNKLMYAHYALGKAYEDREEFTRSFQHYQQANDLQRQVQPNNIHSFKKLFSDVHHYFNAEFFRDREGWGLAEYQPIFIVGLPRSGTTLMEQILASHSMVEPTSELSNIISYARQIGMHDDIVPPNFFEDFVGKLSQLSREDINKWALMYIDDTAYRRNNNPIFIDKMPSNFWHIPFIKLMFPNAKFVAMHRHPMSSIFSVYKQCLPHGHSYSNGIQSLAQNYRYYVEIMQHYKRLLPDDILTVHYENLVENTQSYIEKTLNFCNLPFEQSCVTFYNNKRAIRTPSSEQVRQPIYKSAVEHWRSYENFLAPAKDEIPDLIDLYDQERKLFQ